VKFIEVGILEDGNVATSEHKLERESLPLPNPVENPMRFSANTCFLHDEDDWKPKYNPAKGVTEVS
jgi:hypothetical protein